MPKYCENCNTALQGDYCHQCGQSEKSHLRFFGDIVLDLLATFFSYDSKFNQTFKPLLLKPGYLSNRFNNGQRVRYLHPFRLYLFTSLICFLMLSLQTDDMSVRFIDGEPISQEDSNKPLQDLINAAISDNDQSSKEAPRDIENLAATLSTKTNSENDEASQTGNDKNKNNKITADDDNLDVALNLGLQDPALENFITQQFKKLARLSPTELAQLIIETMPPIMLVLLPLLALLMKLLYLGSKRYYVEHLIVVLHAQSFLFVVIALLELNTLCTPLLHKIAWLPDLLHSVLLFWALLYIPLMLRRVYGQSRRVTLFKYCAIIGIYGTLTLLMLLLSLTWSLLSI